ncbi:MAG TPA: bifunctional DNA primase/polymerase [Thermoguttaceae bacterium]|nr:bifunctional DNA primase/polymerase [Thermoguttaceae bacterium]
MHDASSSRASQGSVLKIALEYHRRGWSVIPIRPGTKKPACRSWKPYQSERPEETTIRRWFSGNGQKALAVIMGEVSGGLVCRDFDDMTSYGRWEAKHPDLARTLPTAETGRPGRHVYARADIGQIRSVSKTGGAILEFDDGELRGAGYCLVPPSPHPNGTSYRWIVPLGDEVPAIDLNCSGFFPCNREARENVEARGDQSNQKTFRCVDECSTKKPPTECLMDSLASRHSLLHRQVEAAISRTLPTGTRQRHKLLFELARELKALPGLADAPIAELKPYVREWHKRALPHIHTKPFEESWFDFAESWGKVKFPKGKEPIAMMFAKAVEAEVPEVAKQYEQTQLRWLVALCRELQRACGAGSFFLDTRTAGRLLGIHHATASRWLRGLRHDGIIKLESRGSREERRASRYRYLAPL